MGEGSPEEVLAREVPSRSLMSPAPRQGYWPFSGDSRRQQQIRSERQRKNDARGVRRDRAASETPGRCRRGQSAVWSTQSPPFSVTLKPRHRAHTECSSLGQHCPEHSRVLIH